MMDVAVLSEIEAHIDDEIETFNGFAEPIYSLTEDSDGYVFDEQRLERVKSFVSAPPATPDGDDFALFPGTKSEWLQPNIVDDTNENPIHYDLASSQTALFDDPVDNSEVMNSRLFSALRPSSVYHDLDLKRDEDMVISPELEKLKSDIEWSHEKIAKYQNITQDHRFTDAMLANLDLVNIDTENALASNYHIIPRRSELRYVSPARRDLYFSSETQSGVTKFFTDFAKTVAGVAGLTVLTTLTGSALVPVIGVPLLCEWLSNKGGDNLAKWANEERLYDPKAFEGDETAVVRKLANRLRRALDQNDALVADMGRFIHATNSIQTLVKATQKDKQIQASFFNRLSREVGQQQKLLNNYLASDLRQARFTIINTGGGAYIGGSVTVNQGDFIGRDRIVRANPVATQEAVLGVTDHLKAKARSQAVANDIEVNTEGGAYVVGSVTVNKGDFVSRDSISHSYQPIAPVNLSASYGAVYNSVDSDIVAEQRRFAGSSQHTYSQSLSM